MSKCDSCQRKSICHIKDYIPEKAIGKIIGCWQYRQMNKKKKLYLTNALVEKAGGIESIERLFDYQCEVVIVPDSYENMAQGPD